MCIAVQCVSWVDVQFRCHSHSSGLTDACALCREVRLWWWRMDRAWPQSSACRPSPQNSRRRCRRWDFPQTLLLHMGAEINDWCVTWLYQTQKKQLYKSVSDRGLHLYFCDWLKLTLVALWSVSNLGCVLRFFLNLQKSIPRVLPGCVSCWNR